MLTCIPPVLILLYYLLSVLIICYLRTVFRARHVCVSVHMEAVGRDDEGNAVQSSGYSSVAT